MMVTSCLAMHLQKHSIIELTQERLELKNQMSFIPSSQFDVELFLLASRMFIPFLDCSHGFDPTRAHMMLVLMLDLKFKGLSIVNNYVKE